MVHIFVGNLYYAFICSQNLRFNRTTVYCYTRFLVSEVGDGFISVTSWISERLWHSANRLVAVEGGG